jgi:hypothetical protein
MRSMDQMMLNLVRLSIATIALWSACASQRYSAGPHYFSWANIYVTPPIPTDPITKEKADSLAASGTAFYVAEYNGNGEMGLLKKVYQGATVVVWRLGDSDGGAASPR